ncbi:hypothetical protein PYCCODRAFT_1142209 [Trametes coccinea BRFM310]|uniref:Uncharacterized protein n=1 Tax=Trametes coccinea (strain BRFM310) TaxID=1353009 RepID=A0A1Y2I8G8_TRAC3|nr:hypothetical protein PYCCODRAFT_1265980 [Trametes coccinea BRFM310]OSC97408.1 hypothetical protein PYCCODRAFT_1142209 [Trametes coccinea BRFM310]
MLASGRAGLTFCLGEATAERLGLGCGCDPVGRVVCARASTNQWMPMRTRPSRDSYKFAPFHHPRSPYARKGGWESVSARGTAFYGDTNHCSPCCILRFSPTLGCLNHSAPSVIWFWVPSDLPHNDVKTMAARSGPGNVTKSRSGARHDHVRCGHDPLCAACSRR